MNHVNILMSLENQTVGFIDNCFKDITKTKRQKGNIIMRYDPNNKNFDLSFVIKEINKIIFKKENKVIKVEFV